MKKGILAKITVLEGKNAEFEKIFTELTEQVLANEAGAVFYVLNRSQKNPQVYTVMEQYESAADIEAHGKTEYFQAANKKLAGLVAGAPEIEVLDVV